MIQRNRLSVDDYIYIYIYSVSACEFVFFYINELKLSRPVNNTSFANEWEFNVVTWELFFTIYKYVSRCSDSFFFLSFFPYFFLVTSIYLSWLVYAIAFLSGWVGVREGVEVATQMFEAGGSHFVPYSELRSVCKYMKYICVCVCEYICICKYTYVWVCKSVLFGFYGISTLIGYLTPNPVLYKIYFYFKLFNLVSFISNNSV